MNEDLKLRCWVTTIVKLGVRNTFKRARPIPHQCSEMLPTNLAEKVLKKGALKLAALNGSL